MKPSLKEKLLALYTECFEKYGDIQITCEGAHTLPIDRIVEFQGDLKTLKEDNLLKLSRSMFINGVCAPMFYFSDSGVCKLLDGHGRLKTLLALREAGIPIPGQFPVDEIFAKDEQDARQKLLAITGQYGTFQKKQLDAWVADLDPEVAETLSLVDTEIELAIASVSDDVGEPEGGEAPETDLAKLIAQIAKLEKKTGNPVFTEIREFAEGLVGEE